MPRVTLNVQQVQKMSAKALYRNLVKYIRYYPSRNRQLIWVEAKENFRKNKNLTDEKDIKVELKKARMGLANVLMFVEKNDELQENYTTKPANYENLNVKDDEFLYF